MDQASVRRATLLIMATFFLIVDEIIARFRPRTQTYWELWVDGEHAVSAERPPALDAIDEGETVV